MDYAPLQIIHIYFDTWTRTYDQVERDARTTFNAMLGVIGGTMGLLTGTAQACYYHMCLLKFTFRILHS